MGRAAGCVSLAAEVVAPACLAAVAVVAELVPSSYQPAVEILFAGRWRAWIFNGRLDASPQAAPAPAHNSTGGRA